MKAIVAMDPNRVIGHKGNIPWHYQEDMNWFKEFTMWQTLIMGYNTYRSLPVYLKGRQICVLINKYNPSDCLIPELKADSVYFRYPPGHKNPMVMDVFRPEDWQDAIVAGGAKTYFLLLPYITDMYVTHIANEYEGDTFMPEFESQLPFMETVKETRDFIIARHMKENPAFLQAEKIRFVI